MRGDERGDDRPVGGAGARVCERCGALNGGDFDRCIRCGTAFSPTEVAKDQLRTRFDGRSLIVTKLILVLTVLVFAGQTAASMARGQSFGVLSGGDVASLIRYGALPVDLDVVTSEPFRLLSAVFVHFGLLHIGMNMLGLWNLARIAEPGVGSARFALAYVGTGILSFATTMVYAVAMGEPLSITGGASGALFGVMGVILGWMVRRRDPRWKQFAMQAVLYSVAFGFMVNAASSGIRINNSAHLGGLAAGFAFGFVFAAPRRSRSDALVNAAAVVALGASVVSLLLTQASPLWRAIELGIG